MIWLTNGNTINPIWNWMPKKYSKLLWKGSQCSVGTKYIGQKYLNNISRNAVDTREVWEVENKNARKLYRVTKKEKHINGGSRCMMVVIHATNQNKWKIVNDYHYVKSKI